MVHESKRGRCRWFALNSLLTISNLPLDTGESVVCDVGVEDLGDNVWFAFNTDGKCVFVGDEVFEWDGRCVILGFDWEGLIEGWIVGFLLGLEEGNVRNFEGDVVGFLSFICANTVEVVTQRR